MFNQNHNNMAKSKFKVGDKIKIVANELQSRFVGKEGIVKKVYHSFTDEKSFYRIQIGNVTLYGVAQESDIEAL